MSETTSGFQKGLAGFFSLAGVALAALIVLGVTRCIQFDRWKHRTCLSQGGALVYVSGRDTCMKVEMTPIAMPVQP